MKKEDLLFLKKKITELSEKEKRLRDIELRKIATGETLGPPTGYASIDKPWLKYYPEEAIKTEIPKTKIYDLIFQKNKNRLNEVAFSYLGRNITYQETFEKIEATAKSLKQNGVKPGDIVTMAMAMTPEAVYILYALNRIGAVVNTIDPRLTSDEITKKINDTNSKVFIGVNICINQVNKIENQPKTIISVSPFESAALPIKILGSLKMKNVDTTGSISWTDFIKTGKEYTGKIDSEYVENQPVAILYTGGTTGTPKGVVLTNENFNTMAITQEISGYAQETGDTFLTFLPPFTAYSLVNAIHDPLYLGFKNVLIPAFTPTDFPELMKKYKPNHVLSGPILWDYLIKSEIGRKIDLSKLKSAISGGDSLNEEQEKQINEFLKEKGCKYNLAQGYGMTEVSAAACYSKDDSYLLGSVGIPYVKNTISIFDIETQEELTIGQEGEICIQTPTAMLEYYNNPEATNEVKRIHEDGTMWIHTGDIGTMTEDGHIFIKGRIKRMIVRSGNKIFPSTIETIIQKNPAISAVSIVGMKNETERHVPVAHIVLKDEYKGLEESIINEIENAIKQELASFNIPYTYIFREKLPITGMNKVNFKQLEEESEEYISTTNKINYQSSPEEKRLTK